MSFTTNKAGDQPYENPSRLASKSHQDHVKSVLGLNTENLTNADPLQRPRGGGAGRVKRFTYPSHDYPVHPGPSAAANVPPLAAPGGSSGPQTGTNTSHLRGYPSLATFVSTDQSFFIFRRFDNLAARNLLNLQNELSHLETHMWNLHSQREDQNATRKQLMDEIRTKLDQYQKAMKAQATMLAFDGAPSDYVESFRNWVDGNKPTIEEESHFLDNDEDLCSLAGGEKEKDVLERLIETRWAHLFVTKKHQQKALAAADSHVFFYSSRAIKRVVRVALTLIAVAFLIGPVAILNCITSPTLRLVIITAFAVSFALALAVGTKSRNHEIFAAMAAYLAVLVVFVGKSL
ncbi:hypothetical protein BDD12DRAFT_863283 [Trichophaea hybrida]|nr:hypothetical protein BDD12DRAFT_863283 [Trichophaea hybrida]